MGEKSLIFTSNTWLFLEYSKTAPIKPAKKNKQEINPVSKWANEQIVHKGWNGQETWENVHLSSH